MYNNNAAALDWYLITSFVLTEHHNKWARGLYYERRQNYHLF